MNDFLYSIPAEVIFGELKEKTLIKYLNKYKASKVLLIYGKNSIKKNGLYELITSALKSSEIDFYELAGVNPNPDITDVARGYELVTSHKIDLLLAVGGGSTIDWRAQDRNTHDRNPMQRSDGLAAGKGVLILNE